MYVPGKASSEVESSICTATESLEFNSKFSEELWIKSTVRKSWVVEIIEETSIMSFSNCGENMMWLATESLEESLTSSDSSWISNGKDTDVSTIPILF